jgi:hypothetical protein
MLSFLEERVKICNFVFYLTFMLNKVPKNALFGRLCNKLIKAIDIV